MATIPVYSDASPGQIPTIAASESGDKYANDGETALFVFNSSGSAIVVTRLVKTQPEAPDICQDNTVSCSGSNMTMCSSVSPRRYNDGAGYVQVRYPPGQAINLTVVAIRTPRAR